jgi:hypothetical protein
MRPLIAQAGRNWKKWSGGGWGIFPVLREENGGPRYGGLGRVRFFVLRRGSEIQKVTFLQKIRMPRFGVDENACEIFHKLSCIATALIQIFQTSFSPPHANR